MDPPGVLERSLNVLKGEPCLASLSGTQGPLQRPPRCFLPRRRLLLFDDDPPVLHVDAVAVPVLAAGEEVVLALDHVAHDLPARLALERDDGREVLALLRVVGGE